MRLLCALGVAAWVAALGRMAMDAVARLWPPLSDVGVAEVDPLAYGSRADWATDPFRIELPALWSADTIHVELRSLICRPGCPGLHLRPGDQHAACLCGLSISRERLLLGGGRYDPYISSDPTPTP